MMLMIFFYGVGAILVLTILLKIPGVELLVRPIVAMLQKLIETIVVSLSSWVLWLAAILLSSHAEIIRNLLRNEEDFDTDLYVERQNRNS